MRYYILTTQINYLTHMDLIYSTKETDTHGGSRVMLFFKNFKKSNNVNKIYPRKKELNRKLEIFKKKLSIQKLKTKNFSEIIKKINNFCSWGTN